MFEFLFFSFSALWAEFTDLDLFGESGAEHESLSFANFRHSILLNDSSNLGLKSHVKHTIGLIQDTESDRGETFEPLCRQKYGWILLNPG